MGLSPADRRNNAITDFGQHGAQFAGDARRGEYQRATYFKREPHRATARVMNDHRALGQPGLFQVCIVGLDAALGAPVADVPFSLGV